MTSLHPAATLPDSERQLAVQALAASVPVSLLALQHGVNRKFVYHQKNMASAALDEVFASSAPDNEVLFELPVTRMWRRQLTLCVTLIGHGSCRGIVELMRDLLGVQISEGTVLNIRQAAARQVGAISRGLDLSPIRGDLHDEIV